MESRMGENSGAGVAMTEFNEVIPIDAIMVFQAMGKRM